MEITIDKKEHQKISLKFRQIASRLLKTNWEDGMENLKRFLNAIESEPIIIDFINNNNLTKFNIKKDLDEKEYLEPYKLPISKEDEIAYVYQLLKYCNDNCKEYLNLCQYYYSGNFQERVDQFNSRVVLPFINHINSYLEEVAIDMNLNENGKTTITINNTSGQVNLAQDSSIINAVQNNQSKDEIENLLSKYKDLIQQVETSKEEKDDTVELIDVAFEESKKKKPKKSIIKVAIEKVEQMTKLAGAAIGFTEVSQKLIDLLSGLL